MSTTIKLRRGLAADWTSVNPILSDGEPGWERDTGKLKMGDGVTEWNSLEYYDGGAAPAPTEQYIVVAPHGTDADYPRPDALIVYWLGAVEPLNALDDDLWNGV